MKSFWAVDCKLCRESRKIGVGIVSGILGREIVRLKRANSMIVTSSYFSKDAICLAVKCHNIELRNRDDVRMWSELIASGQLVACVN